MLGDLSYPSQSRAECGFQGYKSAIVLHKNTKISGKVSLNIRIT